MCKQARPLIATVGDGRLVRVTGDPESALYERYACVVWARVTPEPYNSPVRAESVAVRSVIPRGPIGPGPAVNDYVDSPSAGSTK
jgi:hypothetical protein